MGYMQASQRFFQKSSLTPRSVLSLLGVVEVPLDDVFLNEVPLDDTVGAPIRFDQSALSAPVSMWFLVQK